jgi:hypothetical protein
MNIYGLARSGNHAVIFWILHNIADSLSQIGDHQIYVDADGRVCFINNCGYRTRFRDSFDVGPYSKVIRSYEDVDSIPGSFVVVRDFANLVCSRYKHYDGLMSHLGKGLDLERLISVWKQHVLSPSTIFYNKWLVSKEYRNGIGAMVNVPNVRDKTDYVSSIGSGSSFGGIKLFSSGDYTNRHSQVVLPDVMVDRILGDKDLVRMNRELFDMNLGVLRA